MDKREHAELEAELVQIRTDIESLTLQMADSMSPERLEAVLRPLREQAKRIQIQLEGSGTVVAGDHNVVMAESATYINNSVIVQVAGQFWQQFPLHSQLPSPQSQLPDLQQATIHYLTYLINRYRFLELRGLGIADRVPLKLPLLDMFVPLQGRPFLPTGETWDRELTTDAQASAEQLREPVPVSDLLRAYDGLILLGDPGSGKTTFMLYLALLLATGQADRAGLGSRLPLLLPLSAYANVLADRDVPLQEFIETYYRNLGIDLPLDIMLRETLARGGALLLLDGLDEVKSLSVRHLLVDRVMTFFAFQRQSGNKMVVTSRLVGYREVRPVLDGVAECMLVDFGDEQIRDFVGRWTRTVAQAVQGTAEVAGSDVQREEAGLLTAVFDNSGIRRLATNPLLLTILALMRRQNVSLPQRRVELYDHYVKTLIKHWNLARGLDRPPQHDLDIVETTHVLAPLALWMQETKPGLGYVPEQMMLQELTAIFAAREQKNPVQAAQQFLQDARAYTGLLLERGPGIYGFLHRTFQEFFAAVAIVQKGQQTVGPIVKMMLAHLGDEAWHEVLRLAVAVLGIVQQRDEAAGEVIMQLLMRPEAVPGTAVLLAGDALLDLWPGGVPAACREVVMTALQETMHDEVRIKPLLRMHVGAALGRLDVPADGKTAVDPMLLCYVLGSPFWLGEDVYESHNTILTYPYWISRYPITQGQFAEFVADGGYERANFWGEAVIVARWENGRVQDWSSRGWRNAPHDYGDPFRLPNHPVVGVTWYEALAFTRWLTERWQAVGWLPPGWQVALPSEIEWEKAARGGMYVPQEPVMVTAAQLRHEAWHTSVVQQNSYPKRPYPWGDDVPDNRANFQPHGLNSSSAVGCFPGGRSPYGCEEMSGNVWEWTRSHYKRYPYVPTDGREESQVKLFHQMTLRGGAFWTDASRLRCVSRIRRAPNDRNDNYGFRIVIREIGGRGE